MSTNQPTKLKQFHTYAEDLAKVRSERGLQSGTTPKRDPKQAPKPIIKKAAVKPVPPIVVKTKSKATTITTQEPKPIKVPPIAVPPTPVKTVPPPKPVISPAAPKPVVPLTPTPVVTPAPVVPKPVPTTETKIPAFHELQKKSRQQQNKPSVPTNKKPNVDLDSVIITDNKTSKNSLFANIGAWFVKLFGTPETTSKPAPTPIIKHTQATPETPPKPIGLPKPVVETEDTETAWSPYTESGYGLLEGPDESEEVISPKPTEATPPAAVPPKPLTPPTPKPIRNVPDVPANLPIQTEQPAAKVVVPPPKPVTPTPVIPKPLTPPTPKPVVAPKPIATPKEPTPAPIATKPSNTAIPPLNKPARLLTRYDTNTITIALSLGIILVVITIFVIHILISSHQSKTPTLPPSTTTATLDTATLVEMQLSTSTSLTEQLLSATTATTNDITEFAVLTPVRTEVSGPSLTTALGFHTLPQFSQSIDSIRFVTLRNTTPSILFTFHDIDTVRGGFLSWEQHLAADLQELYALPADVSTTFTDSTIADIDVRILRHQGQIVIIYGLLDDTAALIASDSTTFSQLIEHRLTK